MVFICLHFTSSNTVQSHIFQISEGLMYQRRRRRRRRRKKGKAKTL